MYWYFLLNIEFGKTSMEALLGLHKLTLIHPGYFVDKGIRRRVNFTPYVSQELL